MSKPPQKPTPTQEKPKIYDNSLPNEVKIIRHLLKEMDINDYDPQVIPQLLDFAYNYIAEILEKSKDLSEHAGHHEIELSDVKLGCSMQYRSEERKNTKLPSNFKLAEYARKINEKPLKKEISQNLGLGNKENSKLPVDRYCVHFPTYERKDVDEVVRIVEERKGEREKLSMEERDGNSKKRRVDEMS